MQVNLSSLRGKQFRCFALIDSGADHCCFPASFALQLGLDPLTMKKTSCQGVGGISIGSYEEIDIDLGNGIVSRATTGFLASLESIGYGLLGQYGFFDKYRVDFRHAERRLLIDPLQQAP